MDGLNVEISIKDVEYDENIFKKSTVKKCFMISDGLAITKTFRDFYENRIRLLP